MANDLTQSRIRQLVHYNKDTGSFRWRKRPVTDFHDERACKIWNTKHAGMEIQNRGYGGYLYLNLSGKRYPLHRLAWLYVYGVYDCVVDHVNLITSDNSISNLRLSSVAQNARHQSLKRTNRSGFKGVHFSKQKNKWVAHIRTDEGRLYLGSFADKAQAARAYDKAAIINHGEFALTNEMMGLYCEK